MSEFDGHTPGPWFVSGARHEDANGHWHRISRYDEAAKQDENIALVSYDPKFVTGFIDARLIAAAPNLLAENEDLKADIERHIQIAAQIEAQRDALLETLEAALVYGLIPVSSAKEGGASAHSVAAQIADMARDAVAKARGGEG